MNLMHERGVSSTLIVYLSPRVGERVSVLDGHAPSATTRGGFSSRPVASSHSAGGIAGSRVVRHNFSVSCPLASKRVSHGQLGIDHDAQLLEPACGQRVLPGRHAQDDRSSLPTPSHTSTSSRSTWPTCSYSRKTRMNATVMLPLPAMTGVCMTCTRTAPLCPRPRARAHEVVDQQGDAGVPLTEHHHVGIFGLSDRTS